MVPTLTSQGWRWYMHWCIYCQLGWLYHLHQLVLEPGSSSLDDVFLLLFEVGKVKSVQSASVHFLRVSPHARRGVPFVGHKGSPTDEELEASESKRSDEMIRVIQAVGFCFCLAPAPWTWPVAEAMVAQEVPEHRCQENGKHLASVAQDAWLYPKG